MKPTLVLALSAVLALPAAAGAQSNKACDIVKPGEVQAALGQAVALAPASLSPTVEACSGKAGAHQVTIRRFQRTKDPGGEMEKAGIEAARKAGYTVDVQKSGPITCVAMEGRGSFTASCTAAKPPQFAVIEVSGTQKVPMDKLRPIAERMLGRL